MALILMLVILTILSSYLIKMRSIATKRKLAPRVPGAWPLIGHLPALSPRNPPLHEVLAGLADDHGPVFTLQLGRHSVLVVNSSHFAKEIFTTNDLNVTCRPSFTAAKILGYDYALFPFTPGGPYWQKMRKMSVFHLLSNHQLEKLRYIRLEEVETSIKEMYRMVKTSGKAIEMKQWILDLNMNVLLRMVIGKKFSSVEDGRQFQQGIREVFRFLGTIALRDVAPFLGWIDICGHEKRMEKTAKDVDFFLGKWLEEHKMKRLLGEDHEDGKDFMDSVISFIDSNGIEDFDADSVTKATCLGLIAGYETIAVALTWTISLLLNNKQALEKAQEELHTHVGTNRKLEYKDITKLVYLQAIVKESLRLYPPAFIPGPRKFVRDCNIGGYHVPKDTWLMLNLWKMHRDPNLWEDPMEFKPERFLTAGKKVGVWGQDFELLPFGAGRRECPAKMFGVQMMHYSLASLLHAFELSTPNNEPVDMTPGIGLTNMKVRDLEVFVSPRLPTYCFE